MTWMSVHVSSSCMKLTFFCSDIYLSLSASLNSLAAGSLPCSLHPKSSRRVPCRVIGRAARREPAGGGFILASALIRQGGGYNERPASKATLVFVFWSFVVGGGGGSRPEGLVPAFRPRRVWRGTKRTGIAERACSGAISTLMAKAA